VTDSARRRPPRAPRLGRRLLAVVVAVLAAVIWLPSCVAVLGLDGYRGAADELCSLLDRCYGEEALPECMTHVAGNLDAAEPGEIREWLVSFADESCLESCTSARRCLDLSPVCEAVGADCAALEECCGFSKGLSNCDAEAERCCRPKGTPCEIDEDCCADGGRCTEAASGTRTCGGVECKPPGEPCAVSTECCTKICEDTGLCSENVCTPDGANCGDDSSCCSLLCVEGVCGGGGCGGPGARCEKPEDCCAEFVCFATPDGGVCSISQCLPELAPCEDPSQCCSNYCDPLFGECGQPPMCVPFGELCSLDLDICCEGVCFDGSCTCVPDSYPCAFDGDCCGGLCEAGICNPPGCNDLGGPCGANEDCCSGRCNLQQGACAWPCATVANVSSCQHDMCSITPSPSVLDPSCPDVDKGCVTEICLVDDWCCCTNWDDVCVGEVGSVCGQSCDATN